MGKKKGTSRAEYRLYIFSVQEKGDVQSAPGFIRRTAKEKGDIQK